MKKEEILKKIDLWLNSHLATDDGITITIDRLRTEDLGDGHGTREKIEFELNTRVEANK